MERSPKKVRGSSVQFSRITLSSLWINKYSKLIYEQNISYKYIENELLLQKTVSRENHNVINPQIKFNHQTLTTITIILYVFPPYFHYSNPINLSTTVIHSALQSVKEINDIQKKKGRHALRIRQRKINYIFQGVQFCIPQLLIKLSGVFI